MYTVTVTETQIEEVPAGKDWELQEKDGERHYEYTPEIIKKKAVTRQLYQRTLMNLNIVKVIRAVDQIPFP